MSKRVAAGTASTRSSVRNRPTAAEADRIVAEVDEAVAAGRGTVTFPRKGRPSLTGRHEASPSVGFRITPELRARAEFVAGEQGVTVSALARLALEVYLRQAG